MVVVVPGIAIVSISVAVSKDRPSETTSIAVPTVVAPSAIRIPASRTRLAAISDHAQFTVTVTAVVAVIAPLEPVTVTV
jgi:hypothetical protein